MKLSFSGFTAAATLAAALGLSLAGPHRATAAPRSVGIADDSDLSVKIISPTADAAFSGTRPVEISAFYQGTSANRIVAVELYLDGAKAAVKTLDVPETRGVVSFLVDASTLTPGDHKIVIRATAADAEVASAKNQFSFGSLSPTPALPAPSGQAFNPTRSNGAAPELSLVSPSPNRKINGMVTVQIKAGEANGKTPYVSLFIDRAFKMLKNSAPYEYNWDTTGYADGYHTLEVIEAWDDETQAIAHAKPLQVYVNNGGRTTRRTDLLDPPKHAMPPLGRPKPLAHRPSRIVRPVSPRSAAQLRGLAALPPMPANNLELPPVAPMPIVARALPIAPAGKTLGRPLPQRRPEPARMAASRHLHSTLKAHPAAPLQMARNFEMNGGLSQMPGLSDPFIPSEPAAPVQKAPPTAPVRNFKPMPPTAMGEGVLASAQATSRGVLRVRPHLRQMAGIRLPTDSLSSPFVSAPVVRVPSYKARVMTPITMKAHFPSLSARHMALHLSSTRSLLRGVGQTSLLFNSTLLRLDRPINAKGNILFSPLRQIFEFGGGSLSWEARTGTVSARSHTKNISLTIGSKRATVNDQPMAMESAPYLAQGRTMVPLSFMSTAMDVNVQYDASNGHLMITSK